MYIIQNRRRNTLVRACYSFFVCCLFLLARLLYLCIYVYIHIYICTYIYIRIYTYICVSAGLFIFISCVAVRCSVLQCVAVCCSVLQCVALCCSVLHCVAVCCIFSRASIMGSTYTYKHAQTNKHAHTASVALVSLMHTLSPVYALARTCYLPPSHTHTYTCRRSNSRKCSRAHSTKCWRTHGKRQNQKRWVRSTHTHTRRQTHRCSRAHTRTHVHTHTCTRAHTYPHTHTHMSTHAHSPHTPTNAQLSLSDLMKCRACQRVFAFIYRYVCMFIHIIRHTCARMHTHTHTHTHTCVCVCAYVCVIKCKHHLTIFRSKLKQRSTFTGRAHRFAPLYRCVCVCMCVCVCVRVCMCIQEMNFPNYFIVLVYMEGPTKQTPLRNHAQT